MLKLNAFENFQQTIVDVKTVAVSEQWLALFFDADSGFFKFAYSEDMDLELGFINKAGKLFYGLLVDFDQKAAKELVEFVFETVFFGFTNYN